MNKEPPLKLLEGAEEMVLESLSTYMKEEFDTDIGNLTARF
ncbi:hypothetical protein [Psychrobacter arcticus]|nr:hypothetical protein [Psychrobacter arcticus]